MVKRKDMKIQYTPETFEEIANKKGIEIKKVYESDVKGTKVFLYLTTYEYTNKDGDIITVVETGTGNATDSVLIATVMVKGQLTIDEMFQCVYRVEEEY